MTGKRALRPDNHPVLFGIDSDHIERAFGVIRILAPADAKAATLADGIVDDAVMPTKHRAIKMHNLTHLDGAGAKPPHDITIAPVRHETDILAVRFVGHRQPQPMCQFTRFVLAHAAKRKSQIGQLLSRCGK